MIWLHTCGYIDFDKNNDPQSSTRIYVSYINTKAVQTSEENDVSI